VSPLTISSFQNSSSLPKKERQAPVASFNGVPVRFGSTNDAQKATKLTFWQTVNAVRKQLALSDPESREIFKGLALKHGPDLALPAFFAIPVVGWAAGLVAMPFLWIAEHHGSKIIKNKSEYLANNKDKPLYHYIKLQDLWEDSSGRPPKKPKPVNPATKRDTASRMIRTWNRLIDTLFSHKEADVSTSFNALKAKLSVPLEEATKNPKPGPVFNRFKRFMNAREALHQKWYYKLFLWPGDWFYTKFPLPKVLKTVVLLPKLGTLAICYMLKLKPRL
jgi:hypothetical protein